MNHESSIILYDGVCALCNGLNQFVLKRDSKGTFRFASIQSNFGRQILLKHQRNPSDLDTFYVVVQPGSAYESLMEKGKAAIFVLRTLGWFWAFGAFVMSVFPARLLNVAYDIVAKNRYRLFGKYDLCPPPKPEYKDRFIEV